MTTPVANWIGNVSETWMDYQPLTQGAPLDAFPVNIVTNFWSDANKINSLGVYHSVLPTAPENIAPHISIPLPAGTIAASMIWTPTVSDQTLFQLTETVDLYCGSAPGQQVQPCCPPDSTTQQLLFQIYATIQEVLQELGGQKLPYVDSTVHANLTNTGAVAISPSAAAIRVDIVTRANPWPDNPGTPDFLFSIGFITPFAVGTPLRGSRLVYDHQIFQYPSYTDQIGWTLPAGVTINIVELTTAAAPASV